MPIPGCYSNYHSQSLKLRPGTFPVTMPLHYCFTLTCLSVENIPDDYIPSNHYNPNLPYLYLLVH